jgi:hypothetical protein
LPHKTLSEAVEEYLQCIETTGLNTALTARSEWEVPPSYALRHSYASYRLAQIQDAAKVALEMGNSPQKSPPDPNVIARAPRFIETAGPVCNISILPRHQDFLYRGNST